MQTLEFSANSLREQSDQYYAALRSSLYDIRTKSKARIWQPHALKVQKHTEEMLEFLKSIKRQLIVGTGINHHFGIYTLKDDQLKAVSKKFTSRNILKEIRNQLKIYIEQAYNVDSISEPIIKSHLTAIKSDLISDTLFEQNKEGFFDDLPFISMFTFILQYEITVRSIENKLIKQFFALSKEYVYGRCEWNLPLISIDKSLVKPGETIELVGGIGSFYSNIGAVFTINQRKFKAGPEGTVSYKFKAGKPGKHKFRVDVEYEEPDGSRERMTKDVYYEVVDSVKNL